ncbi:MAG: DNA cytosine methyltransferase [Candidatus Promineofilum sp.]|nr:DNA cytosine methyltransferase [Promineifilum sp.]
MDIGVMQAGFDVLACIEIDRYACETLRAAVARERRETHIIEADIREIDPYALMRRLKVDSGELDLLCGGPPCQAFSQIGKQHSLNDERGMLLFEMTRFAEAFRPKAIMIEQVKGMLTARDERGIRGGVFQQLVGILRQLGYQPRTQILLAADYGVPQMRERVFVVALANEDLDFEFPEPTHRKPGELIGLHLPPYRTVGEALKDLTHPVPKVKGQQPSDSHMDVSTDGDRRRINGVPEGAWLSSQRHLPADQLCNLTRKDTTKFRRLSNREPSLTLRCGEIFFHPSENRILTPREYMRIHGYPDDYQLKGPIKSRSGRVRHLDQHRQVANSVPPPVARVVAEQIKKSLECHKSSRSLAFA